MKRNFTGFLLALLLITFAHLGQAQYQMEKLNRGVVAVRSGGNNFISWRFLGTEEDAITFNLYRGGTKVNATPLAVTNYTDNGAAANSQYYVRAVVNGTEQPQSETVGVWGQQYLNIPLQIPPGGTTPADENYTYNANDCSVGDVDGDGIYEIFVKWDPSNSKDNSQAGYTGNAYIDCYKLNGTRLWRVNLGRNIRAGAHYTQYQVFDFNGDGKAEMMVKTADGTIDGTGKVIGNANADYRSTAGYILTGPEFLTVFNGETGAAMATVNYLPARGTVTSWGDGYGNRVDRFNATSAYLDGKKASGVFCRGYYERASMAAWDWNGSTLTNRWIFDTGAGGSAAWRGQGDHSVTVGDADSDGKQEIIVGSAVMDDNGTILYNTGYGHGDALHVSDFDPTNPGIEIFNIQERDDDDDCYLYSALQKRVIWKKGATGGEGPGRGVGANISDASPGAEFWTAGGQGLTGAPWTPTGASSGVGGPSSCNFLIYWDGDLARELCNGTTIDKLGSGRIFTATGTSSNNGSKSTPNLVADVFGDWREELILRSSDNTSLRIYSTVNPTTHKIRTLMHDAHYRAQISSQNSSYNQPSHTSFFLGAGVALPGKPNITIIGGSQTNVAPSVSITSPANNASIAGPTNITINATATDGDGTVARVEFYNGTTKLGEDLSSTYSFVWNNVAAGTYSLTAKAIDDDGAVGTSTIIIVTVTTTNAAPVVTITSPTNNTIINGAPAALSITATATDANGTVSKVEFFEGTDKLGEDLTTGYTFNWTNVAAGTYTLTAVATDNQGATTTSAPVVISVIGLPFDCNNVSGGSATLDDCGRCTGGTTGKTACTSVSEAENACKFDGIKEDINEGFNDSGYVNVNNVIGSSISFAIAAQNAGNAIISFRFANGGIVPRPAQLSVNGISIPGTINFDSTGAWNDWEVIDASLTLLKGNNAIVLSATTAGGLPNIDQIGYVSAGLSSGNCGIITSISDDVSSLDDKVFPNPSTKDFNIATPDIADIKVMNMHGVILDQANKVQNYQFGEFYVPGVYVVQIISNGSTKVYRVVKK